MIGNDVTVAFGQTGTFELNVMLPITAHALLHSIALSRPRRATSGSGWSGPQGDRARAGAGRVGLMLVTALAPEIGYDAAAALAKEASSRAHDPRAGARAGHRRRPAR